MTEYRRQMDIYLNGQMLPPTSASAGPAAPGIDPPSPSQAPAQGGLSVYDAGLQHAVGLFETMIARNGRVFRLKQHLERLARSAQELGLALGGISSEQQENTNLVIELGKAVHQTLVHNDLAEARVRLTVTPGPISLLSDENASPQPTVLVVPTEVTHYDPLYFQKGIMVVVGRASANPFDPIAGHKTLAYWARLMTLRDAARLGAGEVIWLNITGHLASGAVSNIFLVKDGVLLTPIARGEEVKGALPAPVLPGVTRQAVIELAESESIEVQRRMLSVDDLLGADEVFLTNSGWQLLPVTRIEKKVIGGASVAGGEDGEGAEAGEKAGETGQAGPISLKLRQALLDLVEKERSE